MRSERHFLEAVVRARVGDREAMNEVLAAGREKELRRFERQRFGADRAQDLAQEFTIRLWRVVAQIRNERSFWKLAWAVARGVAADEIRRRRSQRLALPQILLDLEQRERTPTFTVCGERVDRNWLLAGLREALEHLPPEIRALFSEQLGGSPLRSLASARSVSEVSVKVRLFRGRRRLRSFLEDRVRKDWWEGRSLPTGG